ncbi:MAG: pyrroloquinoline quinone biosynthesis peptide chaperone PqqD [Thiothrix sp.]|nr:pyrroloquinoline quinone biosynthesis peptide chaperone PqqD [Thiothrix sp.]HPQ95306.1 pyrroloquinoline quinone biosynthesis peptide chaperone PqqD [Thiolinea sp.]
MTETDLDTIPRITPGYRLQWEAVQDCHVLLYPEGMVQLNGPAGAILEQVDGRRTLAEVISTLEQAFGEDDLSADVLEFVSEAQERGWIRFG